MPDPLCCQSATTTLVNFLYQKRLNVIMALGSVKLLGSTSQNIIQNDSIHILDIYRYLDLYKL